MARSEDYSRAATPESPVYYRVTKDDSPYSSYDYTLTWVDLDRLQTYKPKSKWQGFDTRAEAVAFAEERGWTKVESWKQAKELARPALAAANAAKEEKYRQYDLSLRTTVGAVTEAVNGLQYGTTLKVWVGEDGHLRMQRASK